MGKSHNHKPATASIEAAVLQEILQEIHLDVACRFHRAIKLGEAPFDKYSRKRKRIERHYKKLGAHH